MTQNLRPLGIAVMVGLLLGARPAAGAFDDVGGTRSNDLRETSHRIEAVMDRGHARLVVRRTLFNQAGATDQAVLVARLPAGAVAVGLRSQGAAAGQRWFRGSLEAAGPAAQLYQTAPGSRGSNQASALLSWRGPGELTLHAYPFLANAAKSVEYTLLMPTRYSGGTYGIDLPYTGSPELAATLTVRPARPGDWVTVNDQTVAPDRLIMLKHLHRVRLHPGRTQPIEGALGIAGASAKQGVNHWRFAVAPKLSSTPSNARIVVILDTSSSMGTERVAAARAAARALLSHFDTASVEVVEFARQPRARFGQFTPVADAIKTLEKPGPARQNGSRVELALELADSLLRREPAASPRRVFLFTDALARSSLDLAKFKKSLEQSHALLHIGVLRLGPPDLQRGDGHEWTDVASANGGVLWHAWAQNTAPRQRLREVFEEWARPIAIDHVEIRAPGFDSIAIAHPERLGEGEGYSDLRLAEFVTPWVELTGQIWSRPVRHLLRPNAKEGQRWAAMVFGQKLHTQLTESEMLELGRKGGVVTPQTSFVSTESGARPAMEAITWEEPAGSLERETFSGSGSNCGCSGSSLGNPRAFLERELKQHWQQCGAGLTARVVLETTLQEVVDVTAVELDPPDAGLLDCLTNAVWSLQLDPRFAHEHDRFEVHLKH